MQTTVNVEEAKHDLRRLLELARQGNEVIIADGAEPIARLVGLSEPSPVHRQRVAGLHARESQVSDDFDKPLSDEFWLGTE